MNDELNNLKMEIRRLQTLVNLLTDKVNEQEELILQLSEGPGKEFSLPAIPDGDKRENPSLPFTPANSEIINPNRLRISSMIRKDYRKSTRRFRTLELMLQTL